ncbi:MAG TPA: DUF3783 domain-containing protein [Spirochaetota bacterium]|nr:DUF3783 domain-containing protein [Spirochaetota bacterium]HQO03652.1 DUF3783 domain-containing protein [Spirochaetota bacterium]HQP48864.1 DUF3783 domain-containing protein [Spirochaetota bacterium]
MAELGLLFYGYEIKSAEVIKETYSGIFSETIEIFGAVESDNFRVEEILEYPEKSRFENGENKFLMFLGFDNEQISRCLQTFPSSEKRPIFCGLTEHNINWKVNYLMEHLIEEKREATKQK